MSEEKQEYRDWSEEPEFVAAHGLRIEYAWLRRAHQRQVDDLHAENARLQAALEAVEITTTPWAGGQTPSPWAGAAPSDSLNNIYIEAHEERLDMHTLRMDALERTIFEGTSQALQVRLKAENARLQEALDKAHAQLTETTGLLEDANCELEALAQAQWIPVDDGCDVESRADTLPTR